MSDEKMREMTLAEYVGQLAPEHIARKEYDELMRAVRHLSASQMVRFPIGLYLEPT